MTTATVDIPSNQSMHDNDSTISKLNSAIGFDTLSSKKNNTNNNYYYSSGSFNFILDKGFKPETLENVHLTSVPFLPNWHQGIISIHGLIIPVIDILSFVKTQGINCEENPLEKTYLLKLEHKEFNPIVLKLDALPRLIDTESYIETKANNNSPEWIKSYLSDESKTLVYLDHKKLFHKIINTQ